MVRIKRAKENARGKKRGRLVILLGHVEYHLSENEAYLLRNKLNGFNLSRRRK